MTNKQMLLLGDEAVALGALDAGLSGVFAYPGTPSTEITEFIQNQKGYKGRGQQQLCGEPPVHCNWSANEKTAMEEALGASYAGKRALVCMKHAGMNVCADPFMGSAMTGANGGLVVAACDDPSMHSSQNEQDSRFYANFAMIPCMEPCSQQEAYEATKYAFDLSEKFNIPVLMRMVTRLSHSRANVTPGEVRAQNGLHFPDAAHEKQWVTLPAIARKRYPQLIKDNAEFEKAAETSPFNKYIEGSDKSLGIIACGLAYNYLMENFKDGCPFPVLKIGQYPFPKNLALKLAGECKTILVMEEGQPVVETMLRGTFPTGITVKGRLDGTLPRTGELDPDCARIAVGLAPREERAKSEIIAPRPPALCQGCGHRDFFTALNMALEGYKGARVYGDIGCYTLGYMPPFKALHTCVEMGASVTMAVGSALMGGYPMVGVVGDSTFTHSGMTGLLDAVNEHADVTICISDNETTAMTGGQDSAGTGKIEAICIALGVAPEHVRTIIPLAKNYDEMVRIIKEELEYHGVSVIVSRRECIQTAKRHAAAKKQ